LAGAAGHAGGPTRDGPGQDSAVVVPRSGPTHPTDCRRAARHAHAPERRMSRILVLWAPDWPVVAGSVGVPAGAPVAVIATGQVLACSQSARVDGVRRGMRR